MNIVNIKNLNKISPIVLLGASGSLGSTIKNYLKQLFLLTPTRNEINLTNLADVNKYFRFSNPKVVINCTGFTDVNGAENDHHRAYEENSIIPKILAQACEIQRIPFIHFSTDYIFDGSSNHSYKEEDTPSPLNVYGQTKLEGEDFIKTILPSYFILRTCWLYSSFRRNFLNFILNADKQNIPLNIVNDQIGCPTPSYLVGEVVEQILKQLTSMELDSSKNIFGTYHVCSSGQTSWYEFGMEIKKIFGLKLDISPISTYDFSLLKQGQALRPSFSVLDNAKFSKIFNYKFGDWRENLEKFYVSFSQITEEQPPLER